MSYRIEPQESVTEAVQRIAREQIDKAIDEIEDDELDRHETVHQVRKRCKKLRGLLRLVRPQIDNTYDRENDWYRDSARRLSCVRDSQSMVETYDKLVKQVEDQVDQSWLSSIREELVARAKKVADDVVGIDERLEEFLQRMRQGRERVAEWSVREDGFEGVRGGLKKTYKRGRKRMEDAFDSPSTEAFHQWRKRAKYHWYHCRLLRDIWKEPMKGRRDEADDLADHLGDEHDLSILREALLANPDPFGSEDVVQTTVGLIGQRRAQLRLNARRIGERLYVERPKDLADRFAHYWETWQSWGWKPGRS